MDYILSKIGIYIIILIKKHTNSEVRKCGIKGIYPYWERRSQVSLFADDMILLY